MRFFPLIFYSFFRSGSSNDFDATKIHFEDMYIYIYPLFSSKKMHLENREWGNFQVSLRIFTKVDPWWGRPHTPMFLGSKMGIAQK